MDGNADTNSTSYISGDDVSVVIVPVKEGRISDWKGGVKDWVLIDDSKASTDTGPGSARGRSEQQNLPNGIIGDVEPVGDHVA